ncbi:MAG TPA: GDSL-type esterase/lipase family protein [Candidatus Acidoferrum sp.]|nr:GDSL-type esterase/lipase family protein [Candidatus Acidoferrum sp.]
MVEVLVFGDSITYGAWDNNGGWVQRLREPIDIKNLVDADVAYFVYNLGVVDETSTGILKRLELEMAARRYVNEEQERIVLFNFGLNDSALIKEKEHRVPKKQFEENLIKLIELAKKDADKVIFIGPTPVDESRANPTAWDPDKGYQNKYVREYNEIIQRVCKIKNIPFLEVFDKMLRLEYTSLLEDGLHLSPAGHLVLYEFVRKFLEDNKVINFSPEKEVGSVHRPHSKKG